VRGSIASVRDLFEVHLPVTDLGRSIQFYRDIIGLRLAHIALARQIAFFWVGAEGNAMLGLWTTSAETQLLTSHTAFRVSLPDVLAAPRTLRAAGIVPLDFDERPTDEPVVLAWMPAASVYFRDPDGHLLEYIAMLQDEPRHSDGVVPWHIWELNGMGPARNPQDHPGWSPSDPGEWSAPPTVD
jgi:lactoylglutathione lyase